MARKVQSIPSNPINKDSSWNPPSPSFRDMSTGNKKVHRKIKKITEKDKRMAQLEKDIARLEYENGQLKRDSADYENRLAAFVGPVRFNKDFPAVNRVLRSVAEKSVPLRPEKHFDDVTRAGNVGGSGPGKKKLSPKAMNSKKPISKK